MQVKEIVNAIEMFQFGVEMARELAKPNLILAIVGDLGAGKTTFLKGFISTAAEISPEEIQSPTFTYLQSYEDIHHFDLYRINNPSQFESAGFKDYLQAGGICCIEWAERIESLLPNTTRWLNIVYTGPQTRQCHLL